MTNPIVVILLHFHEEDQQARDAASCDAAQIPVVFSKWPAGIDHIATFVKSFQVGYPGDWIQDWCAQYGNTIRIKIFYESDIFTIEPENIKAILATDFDNFGKGPNDIRIQQSLLGFGIFNTNGNNLIAFISKPNKLPNQLNEMWKFHRSLSRPFFTRERINDFAIFGRHAHSTLAQLKKRLAEGHPVDFQDLVARFTLDSATEFLFGRSVDSISADLPYPRSSPLSTSSSFLDHPANVFGPLWLLREFWKDRIKPHRKIIDDYMEPTLHEELEKKKAKEGKDDKPDEEAGTFLSQLVQSTDNKEVIRDSIVNIMAAGRDTTAATLTFGVYMLAEHPEILQKLRKEILDAVGNSKMPSYDDLRKMKYLRAFINETLRLYPPVPFDGRTSKNATTWPPIKPGDKPLYVPPNTQCNYCLFWMHRRTDLWGPDVLASTFDPDRFLDERVRKYLTPNPFIFLPFNAGPRICLGQQFAYHEVSFFLVRLLQNFSTITLAPDAQEDWAKPPASWKDRKGTQATEKIMLGINLTLYVKGGLWVTMKEAAAE
ncbi:hypothetical protein MVEN_02442300 [Mycena venus]|uniref:Cytochrome P450 n=1 Tax=Mycena venus TaxID=2733690 RepID=A0A8H6WYH5_9AGAR|nr:hypothetical protein MVEN_02442300 [Mycena venus]